MSRALQLFRTFLTELDRLDKEPAGDYNCGLKTIPYILYRRVERITIADQLWMCVLLQKRRKRKREGCWWVMCRPPVRER